MARHRNGTFAGVAIEDCDVDALTRKRVIADAIGDTALAIDVLTGDNSPPTDSVVNHTGKDGTLYRGALLGIPLVQAKWPKMRSGVTADVPHAFFAGDTECLIIAQPIVMPPGETTLDVVLECEFARRSTVIARLHAQDGTLEATSVMSPDPSIAANVLRARFFDIAADTNMRSVRVSRIFEADFTNDPDDAMTGFFVGWLRKTRATAPLMGIAARTSSPFTVPSETVSDGGGNGESIPSTIASFDATLIEDNLALSSYHLSRLNQAQNAIEEYLTGAPAGGNAAFTLVDSDAGTLPPTFSAFHDHSKLGVGGNEKRAFVPLYGEPLGGCTTIGEDGAFTASWQPPGFYYSGITEDQYYTFARLLIMMPLRPSTSTKLKLGLFGAQFSGFDYPTNTTVKVTCYDNSGGSKTGETTAGWTQRDNNFFDITITDIEFYPGILNRVDIEFLAQTDVLDGYEIGGFGDDLVSVYPVLVRVLGVFMWFAQDD